jgi:hypothetical protein
MIENPVMDNPDEINTRFFGSKKIANPVKITVNGREMDVLKGDSQPYSVDNNTKKANPKRGEI